MSVNAQEDAKTTSSYRDDEIDLFELWESIWAQKKLIAIIVFLAGIFGTVYIFKVTPIYQAMAIIESPQILSVKQVDLTTLINSNKIKITADDVYRNFLQNLDNTIVIEQLMEDELIAEYYLDYLSLTPTRSIEKIEEDFIVNMPSVDEKNFVNSKRVTLQYHSGDPVLSQLALKQILSISSDITKQQIVSNLVVEMTEEINLLKKKFQLEDKRISDEISAEINRLEEKDKFEILRLQQEIEALREKKLLQTEQKIFQLKSNLEIAESLGITKPVNPFDYQRQGSEQSNIVNLFQDGPSRFWLGTETLQQEIVNLEKRDNPDAFIPELPGLLEKLKLLETNPRIEALKNRANNYAFSDKLRELSANIQTLETAIAKIKEAEFSVYRMIKPPYVPEKPIKPNKKLILALSIVLGGMLGIFVALIRSAVKNRRQQTA